MYFPLPVNTIILSNMVYRLSLSLQWNDVEIRSCYLHKNEITKNKIDNDSFIAFEKRYFIHAI